MGRRLSVGMFERELGKGLFAGCTPLGISFALYLFSTAFDFLAIAPGVSFARLTGIVLLIISLLNAKSLYFGKSIAVGSLFAFMGVAILPLMVMGDPVNGINQFFSIELSVLITFLALSFPFSEKDIEIGEISLTAMGVVMCILLFTSSGAVGTEWVSDRIVVNIAGSQQDPNEFCGYYLFAVSFFAYWAVKKNHWWNFILIAVIFYCVLLTGSRGGLLANAAAMFIALAISFREVNYKMRWIVLLAVATVFLIVNLNTVLAMLPSSVAQRFLDASITGGTAEFRTHAWDDVLGSFASSDLLLQIIGHGYGATTDVTFNGLVAHNSLIEVLYTFGFLGFVCYMAIIVSGIMRAMRSRKPVWLASILAFLVLLMTLSAYSFKPFWAVLALSFMATRGKERL